jgi:hypothetical protein
VTDPTPLAPELAADLKARFDRGEACRHCGALHARACPRVRRMTFHPGGSLAGVDFWADGKWSDEGLIWPEDLHTPTSDDERQV